MNEKNKRCLQQGIATLATLTLSAGLVTVAQGSAFAADEKVTVDFSQETGPVYGGATGMLYGLSDDEVPTSAVVAGARPRTVTQMPEGGLQHPNGGALTVSDTFFESNGEDILINIQDQYPKWGYANAADPQNTYPGQADYLAKVRTVVEKVKAEADPEDLDRYVFTPFNEPDWIWYGDWQNRKAQFFADWKAAYALIHEILPGARIAGAGESQYHRDRTTDFLTFAAQNNVLPDIYTWHELDNQDLADYRGNYAHFRALENTLGIDHLPINVTEYGGRNDTGVPGRMIQWISMFEDTKVDANVAYWTYAGNLNDHTAQANGGNGAWWLLKWYADLTGETVNLTPPAKSSPGTLQGVASVDEHKKLATVLLGGGSSNINLDLQNLDTSVFGDKVDIRVARTGFSGQEGFAQQPSTILAQSVSLTEGDAAITIPNSQVMDAYQVIITPASGEEPQANTPWTVTTEAENTTLSGGVQSYDKSGGAQATSGNRDVGNLGGTRAALDWSIEVPRDGTYRLGIFNGTGDKPSAADASTKTGRHALFVDGGLNQVVQYESTLNYVYKGRTDVLVDLKAGTHTFSLRTSADGGLTALPGSNMALDKFDLTEVTGPETATYPAIAARTTGQFAPVLGEDGFAGGVTLSEGAASEFFLSAAESGYYDVTLDYDAATTEDLNVTLNGRSIAGIRAENPGETKSTATVHLERGIQRVVISGSDGTTLDGITVTRNKEADRNITTIEAEDPRVIKSQGVTVENAPAVYGSNVSGQFTGWLTAGRTLTIPRPEGADAGQYNLMVRYANAEKYTGHPYNTDVITRTADVTEAGTNNTTTGQFRHNYSYYNFWWHSVPLNLTTDDSALTVGNPTGNAPNIDSFQLARLIAGVTNTTEADTTAPTTEVTLDPAQATGANGWHTQPVTVTATASDDIDANPVIEGSQDGTTWAAFSNNTVLEDGVHTWSFRAVDASGNTSEVTTATVKVDATVPTVSGTSTPSRTITLTGDDATSGVARIEWRQGTSDNWMTYSGPARIPNGKNTDTVTVRAIDNAGLVSEAIELDLRNGKSKAAPGRNK